MGAFAWRKEQACLDVALGESHLENSPLTLYFPEEAPTLQQNCFVPFPREAFLLSPG